ncbi:MAG: hypothetical protein LJE87_01130 [Deltaproteobacteria bacterium]|nr:hypothetical protein [Deltaproteobacteria bacterium]
MKRLLICLVALIAVFALVMPASAAEMKVNGLFNAKAWARDNYDGNDDVDDSTQYVTQRFRSYWEWTQSENLKLVYRNEIDMEWGDAGRTGGGDRNDGGIAGGDTVNLETKNVYLQFMVPDTPVKATLGLQGVTLHKGWFISDDVAGARFDMNFDPVSITAYWVGLNGLFRQDSNRPAGTDDYSSSNDQWSAVVSGAYKAENMDARLTLGYQRNPNDATSADRPESDDLFLLMGEFNMSFDMFNFFVIAGQNFGEVKNKTSDNRDYEGFMFNAGGNVALDMANLTAEFIYASGEKEGKASKADFQGFVGETYSWAEIISDGYTYDRNANLPQAGGDNSPSNMWAVHVGGDLKPTDTTTLRADVYYVGLVEKRTVAGDKEDEIGTEIDVRLIQKIYDNLSLTVLGCYLIADDGYAGGATAADVAAADNSGDDAFQVGMGIDFNF